MSTHATVKSLVISSALTVRVKGAFGSKWNRNCVERWRLHIFAFSKGFMPENNEHEGK